MHDERVSMLDLAQAHGPDTHGTLPLLMAMPCLLPVHGVGAVIGLELVFRDGFDVVLGLAMTVLAIGRTAGLILMA